MKGNKYNIRVAYGSIGVILFFILLIVKLTNTYFSLDIKDSDLITFKGELIDVKKLSDGGVKKNYYYELKLKGRNNTFQINGLSYDLLSDNDLNSIFMIGHQFEISTTQDELLISENKRLKDIVLNKIFIWREKPNVFQLKANHTLYFNIQDYNTEKKEAAISNLKWGIPISIFAIAFFGLMGYANWKTRFEYN
ncbi:hypothetical protein [uncultured Maribacter sp.]|uniref:hypothetical protein n=1 Tax=uncultured Maribacter sp. TaxID=431308 RepID=UPI0026122E2A|nr:hypothetical protein [uncultured Maribacter sp.]